MQISLDPVDSTVDDHHTHSQSGICGKRTHDFF